MKIACCFVEAARFLCASFLKEFVKILLTFFSMCAIICKSQARDADIAQSVEHLIGNEEVISSNLIISSISESVPIGTDSVGATR